MKKQILALLCGAFLLPSNAIASPCCNSDKAKAIQEQIDDLKEALEKLQSDYSRMGKNTGAVNAVNSNSDAGKIGFSIDATARWFANGSAAAYAVSMPSTTNIGDPVNSHSQFTSNILNSKVRFTKSIDTGDGWEITPLFELGINETSGEEAKSNGHGLKLRHLSATIKKKCEDINHIVNVGQTWSSFSPKMPGQMLCPIRQMVLHYALEKGSLKEKNYSKFLVGIENAESDGAVSSMVDGKRKLESFTTAQGMGSGLDLFSPDFVAKYALNDFEIRGILRMIGYNPKNSSQTEYTVGAAAGVGYNFHLSDSLNIYADVNGGTGAARYMSNLSNHSMLIKDGKKVDSLRHIEGYINTTYKNENFTFNLELSGTAYIYPSEISDLHKDLKKYSLGVGVTTTYAINKSLAPYIGLYYCMATDHSNNVGYNPALHVGLKIDV